MALNKSKGNMYEFVTHTWNTVKGKCGHGCSYCYMKRFGNQNAFRFDRLEMDTDLDEGNIIFVGSSNDMFANCIPSDWIQATIDHCCKFYNLYLFQSKNPKRMLHFKLPSDSNICTTIETNRHYLDIMANSPTPQERANAMEQLSKKYPTMVTIEPILDFDLEEMVALIKQCAPIQVNIGADSGNNKLPEPSKEKIEALIYELMKFTRIDKKRNLGRIMR